MSDSLQPAEPNQAPLTAGALLRQARVAKGLHIAALATSIKVTPRKLELLESDRFDELPGATFTRALAQTVCRSLKIDAAPVLALMPQPVDLGLAQVSRGLNAPFRDKPGHRLPSDLPFFSSRVVLGAMFLLLASAVIYLLPANWLGNLKLRQAAPEESGVSLSEPALVPASVPVATASTIDVASTAPASAPAPAPVALAVATPSAPANVTAAAAEAPAAPADASVLMLRTTAESWVEVIDARGSALLSRMLQPGEAVGLDGALPLRVKIGNASATQVAFKGKLVELVATRDNVAKLELK